jgi:hypothetical protein
MDFLKSSLYALGFMLALLFTAHAQSSGGIVPGQSLSIQSFGASGDGVHDDTLSVQAALNSGQPLICNGVFSINSLVTITNKNVYLTGGHTGCTFILNTAQSMFYANLTGADVYNSNTFNMSNVKFSINAVITSVTGPAQTAAIFIFYPLGTAGITLPLVKLDNINVKPTAVGNYIKQGIYLYDATNVWITNFEYEGERSVFQPLTEGVVFDGTKSPTNLHITNAYMDFVGMGVYAPLEAATGWQGVRIHGLDCVYCNYIVNLIGSSDNKSDYAEVTSVEGAFNTYGVYVTNTTHVQIHDNYVFMSNITGVTNPGFPACYNLTYTLTAPVNGDASFVGNNSCDGLQETGTSGKYGFVLGGASAANLVNTLGPNQLTNLDVGINTSTGTSGWTLYPQSMKNVTTAWQANDAAGADLVVPPLAVKDGSGAATGAWGEVLTNTGSAVPLTASGSPYNIASKALTAGNWLCTGAVNFIPAGTTTQSDEKAWISIVSATVPALPYSAYAENQSTIAAGLGQSIAPGQLLINSASAVTVYLSAQATFLVSTETANGALVCERFR